MDLDVGTWPSAAVATVLAAVVTGALGMVAGLGSGVVSALRWRADERHRQSVHSWQRLTWVLEMAASAQRNQADVGLLLTEAMYDIPGITGEDRSMIRTVLEVAGRQRRSDDGGTNDGSTPDGAGGR